MPYSTVQSTVLQAESGYVTKEDKELITVDDETI